MAYLVIRKLDPELRRRLEDSAARNGRSLSDEAKYLLDGALTVAASTEPLGTAFRRHFAGVEVDLELPPRTNLVR